MARANCEKTKPVYFCQVYIRYNIKIVQAHVITAVYVQGKQTKFSWQILIYNVLTAEFCK